jgi:hypothetical protein
MFLFVKKILVYIFMMIASLSTSDNKIISNDKCSNNLSTEIINKIEVLKNIHKHDTVKVENIDNKHENLQDTISDDWNRIEIGKPIIF